ncbi:hypothetical protein [Pseudomonas sp.]|uniref:hypothetical protein n=1 Tax=Pseudomonas sp. TaxID=306 RepID=UPI0026260A1A|nr:hypothetical protein [Pseudomonas sp.]
MLATQNTHGFLIKKVSPDEWWIIDATDTRLAGPFPTELMATEVASVLVDQPAPPARRRNSKP